MGFSSLSPAGAGGFLFPPECYCLTLDLLI